jgi:hypothetical protein
MPQLNLSADSSAVRSPSASQSRRESEMSLAKTDDDDDDDGGVFSKKKKGGFFKNKFGK